MTSRELVKATLEFRNTTGRAPRQLWHLPWAEIHHGEKLKKIIEDFPSDFGGAHTTYAESCKTVGDSCEIGDYIDDWGCHFINLQRGHIGEVKHPIVTDEDWEDVSRVHIPEEHLSFDADMVNESCRAQDKFIMAGCCPNPFERLQYIRGTEQLYVDLMLQPTGMMEFIEKMHDYYKRLMTKWAQTEVDALNFMDDWGSQNALLINPKIWNQIFRPMYQDYIDIAHKHGKKIFMHSDGNTAQIYPLLIEMGLDAFNSQIFCIGIDNLAQYKGKITFWGEIDRQHMLPNGTEQDIVNAVKEVRAKLWQDGGCIAQCEFGPGANPDNVYTVFKTWNEM